MTNLNYDMACYNHFNEYVTRSFHYVRFASDKIVSLLRISCMCVQHLASQITTLNRHRK
jgi:predicted choloylglycine hydrolase